MLFTQSGYALPHLTVYATTHHGSARAGRDSYGIKRAIHAVLPLIDGVLAILLVPAALLLKAIRRAGVHRLPVCRTVLRRVGVFPIRNHYYEPLFRTETLERRYRNGRTLPGLDLNVEEQLRLLDS